MLKFSPANAKTESLYAIPAVTPYLEGNRKVYSLDLSSGYSCPGAKLCKSRAVPRDDDPTRFRIQDGPHCQFRCFSASQEIVYSATRRLRQHNFHALRATRGVKSCLRLLTNSLPANIGVLRWHVAGDFFKAPYLFAAIQLAESRPDVLFYAYTKSLPFIHRHFPMLNAGDGRMLNNFLITASRGGKYDSLIETMGMREAAVYLSHEEIAESGLQLDHDDSHAATPGGSFALLIHNTQPAGTPAAAAWQKVKKEEGGYARK